MGVVTEWGVLRALDVRGNMYESLILKHGRIYLDRDGRRCLEVGASEEVAVEKWREL